MDTEEDLRDLLHGLDLEPPGASTVDICLARATGRRRARRRSIASIAGVALVVAVAVAGLTVVVARHPATADRLAAGPSSTPTATPTPGAAQAVQPPSPPTSCRAAMLPAPAGQSGVVVVGMDPTGRYIVGESTDKMGRTHPLLWTDGTLRILNQIGTADEVQGIAVNASGEVAWSSGTRDPKKGLIYHTFRLRSGKVTEVAGADGYTVSSISPAGDIYELFEGAGADGTVATWRSQLLTVSAGGARSVRDLQAVDTIGRANVVEVSSTGTAIGGAEQNYAPVGAGQSHAVRWQPDGTMKPLPMLAEAGPYGWPRAIGGNWAAGYAWTDTNVNPRTQLSPQTVVRWDLTSGRTQVLNGIRSIDAINQYGWVIGETAADKPVALLADRVLPLPDPKAPPGAHFDPKSTMPTALNADGTVIAGQVSTTVSVLPVRWSCD